MIAANLFVQIEQTSWCDSQSCTSTMQFLPTKVSALYKFALIIASCHIMLQKACNLCNHCVTVLRYNIWRHLVIPCKKTFGEQGVQTSSPCRNASLSSISQGSLPYGNAVWFEGNLIIHHKSLGIIPKAFFIMCLTIS